MRDCPNGWSCAKPKPMKNIDAKYYRVISVLATNGGIDGKIESFYRSHCISSALTTVLVANDLLRRNSGPGKRWIWNGPASPTRMEMDEIIGWMRKYHAGGRKNAPSAQPGARQERRERADKRQGQRSDLIKKPSRNISVLWGLFKMNY